jgi:sulfite exporter TauE/SafE
MQRWLSIFAGVAILAGLVLSTRFATHTPVARLIVSLKSTFAALLRRRSLVSLFALGLINGLLPCGLVYVAAAGAAATGNLLSGALHMAAFGAGTLPVMLGIGLVGRRLQVAVPFRKWIPLSVVLVAALLLLRGMGLGIPYLSPDLASACH